MSMCVSTLQGKTLLGKMAKCSWTLQRNTLVGKRHALMDVLRHWWARGHVLMHAPRKSLVGSGYVLMNTPEGDANGQVSMMHRFSKERHG